MLRRHLCVTAGVLVEEDFERVDDDAGDQLEDEGEHVHNVYLLPDVRLPALNDFALDKNRYAHVEKHTMKFCLRINCE